ncbi:hypothetical protein AAMO2058_000276000 [Amorphochlora amoebiformis]
MEKKVAVQPPSKGKMNAEDLQLHVEKLKVTEEQARVREEVKKLLVKDGLYDSKFCTEEELTRFCKARNFDIKKAHGMMRDAIKWRNHAKPQDLRPSNDLEKQALTGKTYVAGKDQYGRPVVVMDSSCENSSDHQGKIDNLLFNLEYAKRLMEGNVDKWVLFIYLDNFSFFSAPPLKTSSETNRCLMLRYPERMGHCFLYMPPSIFSIVWKMASPLIDPRTKKKIHFMNGKDMSLCEEVLGKNWRELVGLDKEHSKTNARGYNHPKYWASLKKFYEDVDNNKEETKEEAKSEPLKEETRKEEANTVADDA